MTTLVLRAHGVAGLLTAIPALRAIRHAWPDEPLQLAALASLRPLVDLSGGVDELVPTSGLLRFATDYRRFHQEQQGGRLPWLSASPDPAPDRIVNLHDGGPQSIRCLQELGSNSVISYAHADCPEVSKGMES